jgi:Domain of unknown function (DUF4340)
MSPARRLLVHVAVLAVASLGAVYLWTRDQSASEIVETDVTVWGGEPAEVQRISFESETRKVSIESRSDTVGRWFEGTVEQPTKSTIVQIVSIESGERIAKALAPLRAIRELGLVQAEASQDFGLTEPEGTLTVVIGSRERQLLVGAAAPGGADRYVKDPESGTAYAVRGDFLRDLMFGEALLNEREVHGFAEREIKSVRIASGGKTRELLHVGGNWVDPSTPDEPDDAASAWMTKVGRLRPAEYVAALPGSPEDGLLLRIDYVGLGFLELFRFPLADGKVDWFIRTERTRKFVRVLGASGEAVGREVGGVVR